MAYRSTRAKRSASATRARAVVRPARASRASEAEGSGPFTEEERATLGFFSVEGVGPRTLGRLRARFGTLAEAMRAPRAHLLPQLRDVSTRRRLQEAGDLGALADRCFERALELGAKVLFPGRADWPRQLAGLEFPPVLYVRGTLNSAQARVALVGSRLSDAYGEELSAFFAAGLVRAKVGVVSGGAIGVDAAAHRAALGNAGSTVVVLGSGVDVAYPLEHLTLFREVVAHGGAVVSHLPPGTPGVPQNFKVRNRLIAALSDAAVVVRAGPTSGALGTAESARQLGRPLFAVPGDVTCELSAGCNALLESEGAKALTGLGPLARALGLKAGRWPSAVPPATGEKTERARARASAGPQAGGPAPTSRSALRPVPSVARPLLSSARLPAALRQVWEALGEEPVQFDELARRCRLAPSGLAEALVRLEVIGLCEERPGKVFVRA